MSHIPDGQQKKGPSGCVIAVAIVGALMAVMVILGVIGVVVFMRSDAGQAMGEVLSTAASAGKGPGPDALRKYGCKDAAVVSIAKMASAIEKLAPDAGSLDTEGTTAFVTCVDPKTPLTCDEVARIYLSADKPGGKFGVTVQKSGETGSICDGHYDEQGRPVDP